MKTIGFVFSRKDNQEYSTIQKELSKNNLENKIYTYLKSLVEKKIKHEGEKK